MRNAPAWAHFSCFRGEKQTNTYGRVLCALEDVGGGVGGGDPVLSRGLLSPCANNYYLPSLLVWSGYLNYIGKGFQ